MANTETRIRTPHSAIRILFVILDGLADRPQKALGGKTPLEAAYTPNLDRLAELGHDRFTCSVVSRYSAGK